VKQIFRSAIMTSSMYLNSSTHSRDILLLQINTPRREISLIIVITQRQFSPHLRTEQLLRGAFTYKRMLHLFCRLKLTRRWSHLTGVISFREVLQKATVRLHEPMLTICRSHTHLCKINLKFIFPPTPEFHKYFL
jgi:hypothetical protein